MRRITQKSCFLPDALSLQVEHTVHRPLVSIQLYLALHSVASNDAKADILKVWRQIENPTPSIDAHLLEKYFCQISSRSDMKEWSLMLF